MPRNNTRSTKKKTLSRNKSKNKNKSKKRVTTGRKKTRSPTVRSKKYASATTTRAVNKKRTGMTRGKRASLKKSRSELRQTEEHAHLVPEFNFKDNTITVRLKPEHDTEEKQDAHVNKVVRYAMRRLNNPRKEWKLENGKLIWVPNGSDETWVMDVKKL